MHANFSGPNFWLTSYTEKKKQHIPQIFIYIICSLLLAGDRATPLSTIASDLAAE